MASRKPTTKRVGAGLRLLLPVVLLLVAAAAFAGSSAALTRSGAGGAPTIASDKADYTPGETVTLAGANWQPGESVHIFVNDNEGQTWSRDADVTAADDGTLTDRFQLPNWFVASYSVTATGAVSGVATTSFTDGNVTFALATADTVNPGTWTVSWTKYDGANCVAGSEQSSGTVTNGGNVGIGNNKSVKPTGVTPASGFTFTYWSTTPAGTSPAASVCTNDPDTPRTLYAHFQSSNTAPTAPGTPTASANPNNGAFTLSWSASTDAETPGAVTYVLERKTSGGSTYTTVGSGLTTNSYTFSSGSKETEGSWQYRVKASDGSLFSNYSADSAAIIVDTTPPTLHSVPSNMTLEATSPVGATATWSAITATDAVSGSVAVNCNHNSGEGFPLGTTSVTCSATDAVGNSSSASFNVTVQDTTGPSFSGVPADMTVEATSGSGKTITYTNPTASDVVDGTVAVNCSPSSGSTFPLGETTVHCSATDAHGNTGSASFKVTVQDTTPPTVTVPADKTAEATGPAGAAVSYSASASDIVDGAVAASCTPASGSTFPLGETTVHCSAEDAHHNSASKSFKVTIVDTTPPALNLPTDISVLAVGASGREVSYSASASDLVDGAVAVTCSPASGSTFPVGPTTVNCSASDSRGNTAHGSFKVTVLYDWSGFLQPINDTAHQTGVTESKFKLGQTIPAKFLLKDALGAIVQQATNPTFSRSGNLGACDANASTDTVTEVVMADSGVSFVWDGSQYHYNWSTKGLTAGEYRIYANLADGSKHYVDICLTNR